MMEIKSVQNSVVEYLRSQIATGRLGANQKLNENQLASKLGISRPPIREAFRILESEHLIVSIPRKGAYVTNVSIEDLLGLCQVREMIECYTIDLLKAKKIKELPQVELAFEEATRFTLDLAVVPLAKELSHLPMVVDPSHGTGRRTLVIPMAKAAVAAGSDGIMVEVHPKPESAFSDGFQTLSFEDFSNLMDSLRNLVPALNRRI